MKILGILKYFTLIFPRDWCSLSISSAGIVTASMGLSFASAVAMALLSWLPTDCFIVSSPAVFVLIIAGTGSGSSFNS